MKKPICIYHGNCADGFTAAWAVWWRFGAPFDYHAGVYQDPPPDVSGRDVVIVVRIAQRTHRSLLVIPHGNQERAAWLEIGKVKEMDQLLDGSTRIMAPADLVNTRGLIDTVEGA